MSLNIPLNVPISMKLNVPLRMTLNVPLKYKTKYATKYKDREAAQSRNKQFDQGSLASAVETNIQESVIRSEKYMPKTQRINLTQSNRNMSKLSLEAFNSMMTKDFWSRPQPQLPNKNSSSDT
jgi:hypothetical protein